MQRKRIYFIFGIVGILIIAAFLNLKTGLQVDMERVEFPRVVRPNTFVSSSPKRGKNLQPPINLVGENLFVKVLSKISDEMLLIVDLKALKDKKMVQQILDCYQSISRSGKNFLDELTEEIGVDMNSVERLAVTGSGEIILSGNFADLSLEKKGEDKKIGNHKVSDFKMGATSGDDALVFDENLMVINRSKKMKQTETKFQGILKPENSRKPPVSRFEANRATLPDIQIQLPQNLLQNFLDSQGTRIKGVRSVISAIDVDRDANTVTFLEFDDSASAKEQAKVIAGLISAARLEAEMSDSPGAENLIWQLDQAVIGMDGKLLNIELPVNTETLLNVFGCK